MSTAVKANGVGDEPKTGQVVRWPIPEELRSSAAVAYRNDFARQLAKRSVPEITWSYVYMSASEMDRMVTLASRYLSPEPLRGVGVELGAGCGLLASVVAKRKSVEKVYAVEVCEQMASLVIPKIAAGVLGRDANKVVPVSGSFDDLQLADNSVDFAVEIDSLHHSDDLNTTLRECARVLKPGGWLLCFDRCHPNSVTDDEVEGMLSQVYSREFLMMNNYPPDITLTRRENGEHEYRLFEWQAAFAGAGFRLVNTKKFYEQVPSRMALKGMLSALPATVRRIVYQTDNASYRTSLRWLKQRLRAAVRNGRSGAYILAPKETTVFLLRKPSS